MGESGKFYHDIAQILQTPPPPLLLLGDKKTVYVSSLHFQLAFFFCQFPQGVQPDEESVRIFVEFQRVESAIKGILTQFFLEHQYKPSISSVCFITDLFRKLRHLLNQSDAKLKPIATWLSVFFRARDHLCVSTLSFRGFPCDSSFCFQRLFMVRGDVKLCCDWLWCFPFVLRHSTESVLKLKNAWALMYKGRTTLSNE